jgi:hypothetical protein
VQEKLTVPASTLSHHLHRLILTWLMTQERQATTLICRANYPAFSSNRSPRTSRRHPKIHDANVGRAPARSS